MGKEKGIPKKILDELDIHKKNEQEPEEGSIIVESHQIKISIPNKIRQKMKLRKSTKCKIIYDELNKKIICQL